MASVNPRLKAAFATISYLASSTFAQNITNPTKNCGSDFPTPINGTGSAEVSDDLYVSLSFGDFRGQNPNPNASFEPWRYGYISAPSNSSAQACVYMWDAAEAKKGDDNNGCSGVLSQTCIDYLQNELRVTVSSDTTGGTESGGRTVQCAPNPQISSEEFVSACGTSAKGWNSTVIATGGAIDLGNTTCTNSSSDYHLSIPSGYYTTPLYGLGDNVYDTDLTNYTYYDRSMKRVVPFVVSVWNGQEVSTPQVVCLSADDVVDGSREPDDDADVGEGMSDSNGGGSGTGDGGNGQSAGVSVNWRAKGWMAVGMAGVAVLSLVLG